MRAFFLPVIVIAIATLLSGCMQTVSPLAGGGPQSELDAMAFGPPPVSRSVAATGSSGGAIDALRNSFAAAPRAGYAAPMPVA